MITTEVTDPTKSNAGVLLDYIEALPPFVWLGIFIYLLFRYRDTIQDLLSRVSGFKGAGIEIEIAAKAMTDAVGVRSQFIAEAVGHGHKSDPAFKVEVPEKDQQQAMARARANATILMNKRILWVDDVPNNNLNERRMFRGLGTATVSSRSTEDALLHLADDESQFDLVISDMNRDGNDKAGLELIEKYLEYVETTGRSTDQALPIILYFGRYDPSQGTPANAFGITNRPDQLLHLAIDALSRAGHAGE